MNFRLFQSLIARSSRLEVFYKKGVLKNFSKFTGKHLCQSLFFDKVAGLRPFLQNTSGRLLLNIFKRRPFLNNHVDSENLFSFPQKICSLGALRSGYKFVG